jgi:hypothetical protein
LSEIGGDVIGLERPTRELIEKHRREFELRNNAEEEAIRELCRIFPDNKDYKGVLLKSIVINELYSTQIIAIKNVAKHILELDIDERLRHGDAQVVFAGVPEVTSSSHVGSLRRA